MSRKKLRSQWLAAKENESDKAANGSSKYIVDDYDNGNRVWHGSMTSLFCTHYPRHVADVGDLRLYAASKSAVDAETCRGKDLVINVSETAIGQSLQAGSLIIGDACFDVLKRHVKPVRELTLKTKDGDVFPAGITFWQELYDVLIANSFRNVVVTCVGGHGRTGTTLAALIIANSTLAAEHVIDKIREVHCEQSIETQVQEDYLEQLEIDRDQGYDTAFDIAINKRLFKITWAPAKQQVAAAIIPARLKTDGSHELTCVCEMCWKEKIKQHTQEHSTACTCWMCKEKKNDFERANQLLVQEIEKSKKGGTN